MKFTQEIIWSNKSSEHRKSMNSVVFFNLIFLEIMFIMNPSSEIVEAGRANGRLLYEAR